MGKKSSPLKNWPKKNGQKMAGFAKNTVTKMGLNAAFKDAGTVIGKGVTPAAVTAAADDLSAKYLNRLNGPIAKGLYETSIVTMEAILQSQWAFVNDIANGNRDTILSSGFTCSADAKAKAVIPETPRPSIVTINGSGNITVENVSIAGVVSLCIVVFIGLVTNVVVSNNCISFPEGGNVIVIPVGGVYEHLTGLTPGVQVSVMALAQNAAGMSAFSVLVSKYVS